MLLLRRMLQEDEGGLFRANPVELPVLRYYANSIAHLCQAPVTSAPVLAPVA